MTLITGGDYRAVGVDMDAYQRPHLFVKDIDYRRAPTANTLGS